MLVCLALKGNLLSSYMYFLSIYGVHLVQQTKLAAQAVCEATQGGARNFYLGAIAHEAWGGCPPVRFRDPVEAICKRRLHILTSQTIKICKFRTIHLLILDQ